MAETTRLRVQKTTLAGCLTVGLLSLPGLALAQPPAKETAPKAEEVAPPGPVLKAKAKLDKRAKAKGRHSAAPVAQAPAAGQPAVAAYAAETAPQLAIPTIPLAETSLAFVPQPPRRPIELASLGTDIPLPAEETPTGAIPKATPALKLAPIGNVDSLITKHAARYNVPESLLRRVVKRESGFNPGARNGPYLGLMQMRLDTARGMGYQGGAAGLFDADTNLTYGAAYLANAWRVSGGSPDRAVRLYSSGYYYEAKRKGMLPRLIKGSPSR